jgi:hypothetical protein
MEEDILPSQQEITQTSSAALSKTGWKSKFPLIFVGFSLLILVGIISFLLGKSLYQPKTSQPSISQVSPTPTPENPIPTPTPDPTANWKTYKNEKLGFSLKYPNQWLDSPTERILSTRTEIEIGALAIIVGIFYNQDLGRPLSPEEVIGRENEKKAEKVKVDGQSGLYLKMREEDLPYPKPNPFNTVVIEKDGILYVIEYIFGSNDPKKQSEEQRTFDLILQSFKFIPSTTNWKTYTNSEYKFTFKYPQEFSFQILDEKASDKPKVFLRLYQQENQSYPIIDLILIKTNLTPEQWIKENDYCPSSFNSCTTPVEGPIPKSIQFEEKNRHYAGLTTLFKNKEILFEFRLGATEPNNPIETSVRNTYNLILSTFKFLD